MCRVMGLDHQGALPHARDPILGELCCLEKAAGALNPGEIGGDGIRDPKLRIHR